MKRSLSALLLLVALPSAVLAGGCAQKPTEDECEAFTEHLVDLMVEAGEKELRVRKLATKHKDKMIESCVRGGTHQQVQCTLEATSLEEIASRCKG